MNLHIKSGEVIGILGGTGSSKSTLIQLIPRLYDVTEGSIKVGGVDVRNYDLETLRNNVAVVLQKNVLFSGTIKDNLRWGNENATDEEMLKHVNWHKLTNLSNSSPTNTTPGLSKAVPMSPVDKNSVYVLHVLC